MKKISLVLGFLLIIIMCIGCSKEPSKSHKVEQPSVIYHKTIDVEVTDCNITWGNVKSHYYTGFIEVKSVQYGLKEAFSIANGSPYFNAVYCGRLEHGDKIKAVLYTIKKGDKVIKRYLGELEG